MDNDNLKRIADALEEILRLVKQDMERMKKLNEEPEEGDMRDHFTKAKINEQTSRASNGPRLPAALAMAPGSGTKLQAASGKLQAPSCKLDKTELHCYRNIQEKEL